jgi:hypothetical protein
MKTTVEIPDALFREARAYAASRKLSFKQVIEAGLRNVLEKGRQPKGRFRLRDGSFGSQGLAADGDWQTIRRIIYEGRGE